MLKKVKNQNIKKKTMVDELRPEYNLEELGPGVRGKYYQAYLQGVKFVLLGPEVNAVPSAREKGKRKPKRKSDKPPRP